MRDRLRSGLALARSEGGFTLLELMVVVAILGVLLAMGISYLNISARANKAVARANVVTAVPVVEAYYSDNGAYTGMTWAALHAIDAGLSPTLELDTVAAQSYCISDRSGNVTFHRTGPEGQTEEGGCP